MLIDYRSFVFGQRHEALPDTGSRKDLLHALLDRSSDPVQWKMFEKNLFVMIQDRSARNELLPLHERLDGLFSFLAIRDRISGVLDYPGPDSDDDFA